MFASSNRRMARGKSSQVVTVPAPTKGLFIAENIAAAPAGTALVLDNWFAEANDVRVRRGATEYADTAEGAHNVHSLMPYTNGSTVKLFAACNGEIFDVASGSATSVLSGLTTGVQYQHAILANSGGVNLIVTGNAAIRRYDGSSWSSPAITGITHLNVRHVWSYKNRLFFIIENSLTAYCLDLDAVAGAVIAIPLGGIFQLGGKLQVGATWSVDAGDGLNDQCVFITDQGEVAIYTGSDPESPTDWALVGVYRVGRPIGRRCTAKAGGDLAIITEDGIVPLSQALKLDRTALAAKAITAPIGPLWRQYVRERSSSEGWQIVLWTAEQMGIVNLPAPTTNDREQLVINLETGAWSRFTPWDAKAWAVHNGNLFYGTSDGRIMQAEDGGQDDGESITVTMVPAFSNLGAKGRLLNATAAKAYLRTSLSGSPQIFSNVDYNYTVPAASGALSNASGAAAWGSAVWGSSLWPSVTLRSVADWQSITGLGVAISVGIQAVLNDTREIELRLSAIQVSRETGDAFA